MMSASADVRVLGYLGRALSLELSAVQSYSTQARLVDAWGLTGVAREFSAEAAGELVHAERIISRMLALGVVPNASQLRPVRVADNLPELLRINHAFEVEIVHLYENATRHCASLGDHDNRLFFEALLDEEKQHARHMQEWLQRVQGTGDEQGRA